MLDVCPVFKQRILANEFDRRSIGKVKARLATVTAETVDHLGTLRAIGISGPEFIRNYRSLAGDRSSRYRA